MRRLAVFILFVGLVGLAFAGVRPLNGLAQDSTPMADMASMPAGAVGLTAKVLARVEPPTATGQELQLVRVDVAPGATVAPHTHPGTIALCLESGSFDFGIVEGVADRDARRHGCYPRGGGATGQCRDGAGTR